MSGIDFRVQALNVSVDATEALMAFEDDADITADVTASFDLDVSVAQNLFRFQSDAIDVDNIVDTDLKYKVEYTTTQDANGHPVPLSADWLVNTQCSAGDAIYTAGTSAAANKMVPHEYVRYLATKLFNTHLGVDLFSNETEVREALDLDARTALDAKLGELAALESGSYVDASNVELTSGFKHPSYVILSKIIQNAPERLTDLSGNYLISGSADGSELTDASEYPIFKMPILVGDTIQFKMTINAHADQGKLVDPNGAGVSIPARTYKIVMNVV